MHTFTTSLTEGRKADRAEMAKRTQELVHRLGCTSTCKHGTEGGYPAMHCIQVRVEAPRGLCVMLEFDKNSWQPDVHVMSWHIPSMTSKSTLNPAAFGHASVNPYHFQKATSVAYGFDAMYEELERVLSLAVSGEAFREPAEQAQAVAVAA